LSTILHSIFSVQKGKCRFNLKLSIITLVAFVVLSVTQFGMAAEVRNIILLIGDGMSTNQLESARIVKGAPLIVDALPVRHRAFNASADNAVTDSAAAATALATGERTNNGMIAVSPEGRNLRTVLQVAKDVGKRTGVVTTDAIHGATPGAFLANTASRSSSTIITEQAVFVSQPDVLLGGGMTAFNEIGALERLGSTDYTFVQTREQLLAWQPDGKPLLGLFATGAFAFAVERRATEPHLAEMVQVALNALANDDAGFFLMVESARIDSAGHSNLIRQSVYETLAFEEAIQVALEFAEKNPDTLVIITADHETGGLMAVPDASPQVMSKGVDVVTREIVTALNANPQADLRSLFAQYAGISHVESQAIQGTVSEFVSGVLSTRSFYYTTGGHTDLPVHVFAQGPEAEQLLSVNHLTDIGKLLHKWVQEGNGGHRP
jgi:alkaline phosphatase